MDSSNEVHNQWITQLAAEFPQAADQLGALADHLQVKHERLAALIRYCAAHPELPMMRMYAEYSAALDAVALEPPREVEPEVSDEEAKLLGPRERAARTKRMRSRARIVKAAETFILSQVPSWTLTEVAVEAGVGVATVHTHFRSRSNVLVVAYERLLS